MSIVLQYDPSYRRELNRFVYQLQSWHSKRHLKRKWVVPGHDELLPVYGLHQEGPGAYLHQPSALYETGGVSTRLTIEKGCQIPPGWVDKHLVFHIETGWGCIDISPDKAPIIFYAPALLIVEKADLFSLVAASNIEGSVTARSGDKVVGQRPAEEVIAEAAKLYPMIQQALAA